MSCDIYKEIGPVITVCVNANSIEESRMLNCLKELFYKLFCQRARSWFWSTSINKFNRDEVFEDAFNRGLTRVWASGRAKQLKETLPTETTVIAMSLMQLRGLVTSDNRYRNKNPGSIDPGELIEKFSGKDEVYPMTDKDDKRRQEYELLGKALSQLPERCQQLIVWKKLLKLKNDVIAERLGIDAGSVNNEVYKCMNRLKSKVDDF